MASEGSSQIDVSVQGPGNRSPAARVMVAVATRTAVARNPVTCTDASGAATPTSAAGSDTVLNDDATAASGTTAASVK